MARYRSKDMAASRKNSVAPRKKWKKACVKQHRRQMDLFWTRKLASIFGARVVMYQISRKERFPRKKYMGVCRRPSGRMMTMMRMLPVIVSTYMKKTTVKREVCSTGDPGKPRRINSVTKV